MPIKIQSDLPVREILEKENIFVMDEYRSLHQDIRPLQLVMLNLMPLKEDTELHILRMLSNTPLQIDMTFLHMASHESKNTASSHINKFYLNFDDVKTKKYDGMIITGAPVEKLAFEEVDYWGELCEIMEWTKTHVTSTMYLCWGAQAGLYYHYGIPKYALENKLCGIFPHRVYNRRCPLLRGFDDVFYAPHSRYTQVLREDVEKHADHLQILSDSQEAGLYLIIEDDGKSIYVMGHPEYDRKTLDQEYKRDQAKQIDYGIPKNYYPDDDPSVRPLLTWRANADSLYSNWLNYYVYQATPYEL